VARVVTRPRSLSGTTCSSPSRRDGYRLDELVRLIQTVRFGSRVGRSRAMKIISGCSIAACRPDTKSAATRKSNRQTKCEPRSRPLLRRPRTLRRKPKRPCPPRVQETRSDSGGVLAIRTSVAFDTSCCLSNLSVEPGTASSARLLPPGTPEQTLGSAHPLGTLSRVPFPGVAVSQVSVARRPFTTP